MSCCGELHGFSEQQMLFPTIIWWSPWELMISQISSAGTTNMLVHTSFSPGYIYHIVHVPALKNIKSQVVCMMLIWLSGFICLLLLQRALLNGDKNFDQYKQEAENFMCKILPNSPSSSTQYTQGKGNIPTEFSKHSWANLSHALLIYKRIWQIFASTINKYTLKCFKSIIKGTIYVVLLFMGRGTHVQASWK